MTDLNIDTSAFKVVEFTVHEDRIREIQEKEHEKQLLVSQMNSDVSSFPCLFEQYEKLNNELNSLYCSTFNLKNKKL